MAWRFGDIMIDEADLNRFLDDQNARGKVYLADGTPFLQAHLFADVYTLFWPSTANDRPIIPLITHALEEVVQIRNEGGAREHGRAPQQNDRVSLSVLFPSDYGFTEQKEDFIFSFPSGGDFSKLVDGFLQSAWNNIVSLYATAPPLPDPVPFGNFSLWTDTINTPIEEKETGITASIGSLPTPKTIELMARTSALLRKTGPSLLTTLVDKDRQMFLHG